jgi:hypothetical protein
VISPEQLASALDRLDPRDRELLALSLRRRVPDEDLARMYGVDGTEVARRRAGAIDRLSAELGIRRGEDPSAVRQALLEDEIWSATEARVPEPPGEPPRRHFPHVAIALFGTGVAALLAALAIAGLSALGDGEEASASREAGNDATRNFVPDESGPAAEPVLSEPREFSCYTTAYVRRAATLRRRPGGKPLIRLAARTEWSSPRVFGVLKRQGSWLAVQAPELPNGRVGWLRAREARLDCTTWSLHADLSKRKLFVRREGRTVRVLPVAIGRPGNETPKGRFSVTDKLRVTDPGSPYGCCVLALTGHQSNLPPGWPGGDRLAVHSTQDLTSIGQPASLGCLRSHPQRVRWLIQTIPLGAPVFIRS